MAEVIARTAGENGELVLRRDGEHLEIISNGVYLMDTRDGTSERLLVSAALDRLAGRAGDAPWILIGGLGVGFSLAEAAASALPGTIHVLEREAEIIRWHAGPLARYTGAALNDPRVRVINEDLHDHLRSTRATYDAICLDIDNGPDWTVTEANAGLYDEAGLDLLASRLRPGGVLTVWSAAPSPAFAARLRARLTGVAAHHIERERGEPDVVYAASRAMPDLTR